MSKVTRRDVLAGATSQLALIPDRCAAKAPPGPANLSRGVNLSHWFAQSFEPTTPAHYMSFVGAERFVQLAKCGFDHVRLPIDPDMLFENASDRFHPEVVEHLAKAVALAQANRLAVVIDLHPVGTQKNALLIEGGATRFVQRWRRLAGIIAPSNDSIYLEVLNEPSPLAGKMWWTLQARAIAAIRQSNPHIYIIANGGAWSNVEDLIENDTYNDPRVVYSVHYYAPILFSQQGEQWGWPVLGQIHALEWPLSPDEAARASLAATNNVDASHIVLNAVEEGTFTRAHMDATFADLRRWQSRNGNPPIYVGEFGVAALTTPRDARLRWLMSARTAFESYGWGWAIWDLSPSFGLLVDKQTSEPWCRLALDPDTMSALGLAARSVE